MPHNRSEDTQTHSLTKTPSSSSIAIVTLVSVGQHPGSGRARRSDQDSKALELALGLASQTKDVSVSLLHAGDLSSEQHQAVLREYIGMGVPGMAVLPQPEGADVTDVLSDYLCQSEADIVLTGSRSESGEGSGMMPYLVGQTLGWPVLPAAVGIKALGKGEFEVLQALPRGQRRLLRVRAPFVASVDAAAQEARQTAWAVGQRGRLDSQSFAGMGTDTRSNTDTSSNIGSSTKSVVDAVMAQASIGPARKRPKRIATAKKAKTAADRFKAATAKTASKGGAVMVDESAQQKAEAIYDLLVSQGVLKSTGS